MKRRPSLAWAALLALVLGCGGDPPGPAPVTGDSPPVRIGPEVLDPSAHGIGKTVADLSVRDLNGVEARLSALASKGACVVVVMTVDCPLCKRFGPQLAALAKEYTPKGATFLFVDPAEADTATAIREKLEAYGNSSRAARDPAGKLLGPLGAQSTTDVFVLNRQRELVYRGAVSDQFGIGYALPAPRRRFLRDALDAILAGRAPPVAATTAPGCVLGSFDGP